MRTLRFIVRDQIIEKDPTCDFSGLVPGSVGYLQAEFIFSPEWKGFAKVATFFSSLGKEYTPAMLKDGRTCIIPFEALQKRTIKIQIIGRKEDMIMKTNKVTVFQSGHSKEE